MKIAISTGGGDAPGLNAVIRGAVLAAVHRGWECIGIRRGFDGLLGDDEVVSLGPAQVRGITHLGGTILGIVMSYGAYWLIHVFQPAALPMIMREWRLSRTANSRFT